MDKSPGFRGSLKETPLPQVLRRIFLERLKGTLTLVHGDETRHLFFEKGELRTATSSREGQRIGAFLKRRGWITDEDISWALETVARQGRARLGKILVEKGLVSGSPGCGDAPSRRRNRLFHLRMGEWRVPLSVVDGCARSGRRAVALDCRDHRRGNPKAARGRGL